MKKIFIVLFALILACSTLFACKKETVKELTEADKYVVLTPDDSYAGQTLIEFMTDQKEQGKLNYTSEDSIHGAIITSFNGIYNNSTAEMSWMLYTDDEDNSNAAYGEISYEDKMYASASWGASSLVIKAGCTYVWVYSSYSAW